jgi:hypothetical protein
MALFRKKETDPLAEIGGEIEALDAKKAALAERLAHAGEDLDAAKRRRLDLLLADMLDGEAIAGLDSEIAAIEAAIAGTRGGLDEIATRRADAGRRLAQMREVAARRVEADRLEAAAAAIDGARQRFADAASALAWSLIGTRLPEAHGHAAALTAGAAGAAAAASEVRNSCRVNERALRAGGGRILAGPPVPLTKAPAPAPVVETKVVFPVENVCWSQDGEDKTAARYVQLRLPLAIAAKAIAAGVCDEFGSDRAQRLRSAFGGAAWSPPVAKCVDLDKLANAADTTAATAAE